MKVSKQAEATIARIKTDIEVMKKDSKPEDMIPAQIFFMLMDSIIPTVEKLITTLKEQDEPTKDNRDSTTV